MMPLAEIEGIRGHFRIGQIIHLGTGEVVSFDQLIEQLGLNDLIFVGEVHDNPDHHLIQVQILQALMARYGLLTVAVEFFREPQQTSVDRYIGGSSTETVLLEETEWEKRWGFDYHLYRPMMLAVKERGGKVLAINAPNDIVGKVARTGLSSLTPDERNQLAESINLDDERHRDYLRQVYKGHKHKDLKNFDHFYEAQCVWEDTMAENISAYLKKNKEIVVVFTGNGHIINRFGIPDRVVKRVPTTMTTVVLYPLTGRLTLSKKAADYIWLTGNHSSRHSPMRRKMSK